MTINRPLADGEKRLDISRALRDDAFLESLRLELNHDFDVIIPTLNLRVALKILKAYKLLLEVDIENQDNETALLSSLLYYLSEVDMTETKKSK